MSKVEASIKIKYVKKCLKGKISMRETARVLGVSLSSVQKWISIYKILGSKAFTKTKNKKYSSKLKEAAVRDYLAGLGSQMDICKKYGILSISILQKWIKKYNSHEELNSSKSGGDKIMTKTRKTTFEERMEIVTYCIENKYNYALAAEKYGVSYQQARNYVSKYEKLGVEGLHDKRGKRKPEHEMSEMEKLRAEIKSLRAEKERAEMEVAFLKKLQEIERRRR